jgi:hypothetical protein
MVVEEGESGVVVVEEKEEGERGVVEDEKEEEEEDILSYEYISNRLEQIHNALNERKTELALGSLDRNGINYVRRVVRELKAERQLLLEEWKDMQ